MNEQKRKNSGDRGSGRGRKKIGIIILTLVALGIGAFFLHRLQVVHQNAVYVIRTLLDEDNSLGNNERFKTWSECLDTVRNQKYFQEDLARAFAELVDSGETTDDQVNSILYLLGKAEYEDENIRSTAATYYTADKERTLALMDSADPKSVFEAAKDMNNAAGEIQNQNQRCSDFYQITGIYTESEVRELFVRAAEAYRDAGNLDYLADVLCTPLKFQDNGRKEGDYTAPIAYLDPQEIFDLYAGSTETVYTILSGQGGYYDTSWGPDGVSDAEDYHYGDFFYESHKKGGKTYDMTEFRNNPGLWDSISKDQQDYILRANMEADSKVINCYFRGRQITRDKPQIGVLYEAGFGYAVPAKDGEAYVFLSPFALCLDGSPRNVVFGDFSEQYELVKNIYTGGPDVAAPSASALANSNPLSQQLEDPAPALAPFVPYCGVFEGEWGRFISDFYLADGQVFWTAAPAEEGGELPFIVSEFGEPVSLYTGPCQVKKNNAFLPDTDNVVLSGSDSNGVQYAMTVIFSNNYIGAVTTIKTPDSPAFDIFAETGFNKAA